MRIFRHFFLPLSLLLASPAFAENHSSAVTRYVISSSQLRDLPRAQNGHDYQLLISLPSDYETSPQKRYPVLYACDGNWSFVLLCGMYGGLVYDRAVPEYILVGIGYAGENPDIAGLRLYDYLPEAGSNDPERKKSGHAAEFLSVVRSEIIPFVEREYRVDASYRVLAGGSAGGLFALYTMFKEPSLFQGYIAVSPGADERSGLPAMEANFANQGRPLPVRLFMSGASEDQTSFFNAIRKMDTIFKTRHYPGFTYEWRLVEGQGHGGTGPESFARGIRFAFQPIAPTGK